MLVSVHFYGENFSPTKAEEATGIVFEQKNEPGDIGNLGLHKGKPLPYGSASLEVPENIKIGDKIMWLANRLKGKIEPMYEFGLERATFDIGYFYEAQCNFEFSKEELKAISDLGISLTFSCYKDEE